jgi:hypothetical protein
MSALGSAFLPSIGDIVFGVSAGLAEFRALPYLPRRATPPQRGADYLEG